MKAILDDRDDRNQLKSCVPAVELCRPKQLSVIIERVVGSPNQNPDSKFSDLNMMVQYAALETDPPRVSRSSKGRRIRTGRVVPTRSPMSIIIGKPMSTE